MTRYLILLLALALCCSTAMAAPAETRQFAPVQAGFQPDAPEVLTYASDHILVQFTTTAAKSSQLNVDMRRGDAVKGGTGLASVDALIRDFGVTNISRAYNGPQSKAEGTRLGTDRWYRLDVAKGTDVMGLVQRFAADRNVAEATPDWRAFPAAVPNDPYHADNWGHNNTAQLPDLDWGGTYDHTLPNTVGTPGFDTNAEAAWNASQGYGSASVVVAILDSGVDIDHGDLRLVAGYDYGDNDTNPDDNSGQPGHGTCCAGVAAAIADNGNEVNGVAGGCSVMPLKIANSTGSLLFSAIIDALYHAADNGADIISMSFSADISSDSATDAAILYAYNAGCVLMAATSNSNESHIRYPANNQYVMGIGAASPCGDRKRSSSLSTECNSGVDPDPNGYTCDGERWWGSNYGTTSADGAGAVDVLGPTILPTTDIEGSGGYRSGDVEPFFNGTSCATPYVAGVAALIKSKNPSWTPAQIRDQLCDTAIDVVNVESGSGWDRYSGYGMVDAEAAVGGGGPVEDPPVAAFSGTPTSGTAPLTVSFTDASSNTPTSWSWTFGDGGSSTAQNPSYEYTSVGTYTVTLTATNAYGSDDEIKTGYITVTNPPPPTADFTGSPTSGVYPLDVTFTDQSTGSPTSWYWDFGDGSNSALQNPSHEYTVVGTYTVTLTATNAYGSDDEIKVDYITVTEPGVTTFVTADGETSVTGTVGGDYILTKASDDSRETITEVAYTGHPRKTYSYLQHEWDFTVPAGGDVTFHLEASRSSNADGDDMLFQYSTDGAIWNNLVTVASATETAYTAGLGTVSGAVTVRVTDTDRVWGNSSMEVLSIDYMAFEVGDAQPVAPTADFSGTPTSGEYDLLVTFTDASSGDPTSWSWTFGDGGTSTDQNPQYTYTTAGVYTVSLTATNAHGSDVETKTDYITVTEPGQGSTTMHVAGMVVDRYKSGPNYIGRCVVTIQDDQGQPVSGASVSAVYDGPTNGSANGTTAADGTVTLTSSSMKRPSGEWCFEVTDVTHATLNYNSGDNAATYTCESGVVNSADGRFLPAEFGLDQNQPNPFNPMTNISFRLPTQSHVTLRVYDMRGKVVATLVNETMAAGQRSVTWDARNHASGVYFYCIQADGFSETRKMTLLK